MAVSDIRVEDNDNMKMRYRRLVVNAAILLLSFSLTGCQSGGYSLPEAFIKLGIKASDTEVMVVTQKESSKEGSLWDNASARYQLEMVGRLSAPGDGRRGIWGWSDENYLCNPFFWVGGDTQSVGFWIYLAEPNPAGSLIVDNNHRADEGWAIILSENRVAFNIGEGSGKGDSITTAPLSTGNWHFIVGVSNRLNLRLYVDGELNAVKEGIEEALVERKGICIGRCYSATGRAISGTTVLRDAFVISKDLTSEDIKRLYQLTR